MPANKEAFLRYRIINKMLTNKNNPYPTMEDFIEELEEKLGKTFSESTIQKDIKAMKEDELLGYLAPIKYHRAYHGYYYTNNDYSISEVPLQNEDINAIEFAASTLNQFKDIKLFSEFSAAVEKIFNAVSINSILNEKEIEQIVQFEKVPYYSGSHWVSVLSQHIKNRKTLELTYKKFSDNTSKKHIVHPILLKEYRNRWYLVSMLDKNMHIVIYALDRIKNIALHSNKYKSHPTFSSKNYFKHAYGITTFENEPTEIILKANPIQSSYFETQSLHQTQKIIEKTNNYTLFSITIGVTPEFLMDLLSYGDSVEVLKPKSLRKELKTRLQNTLKLYK